MDNEFPKITFDIFEFAQKHNCKILLWFEEYWLHINVYKYDMTQSLTINCNMENMLIGFNGSLEIQLREAVKALEYRHKKWLGGIG